MLMTQVNGYGMIEKRMQKNIVNPCIGKLK